jgi:hypothetical protein
MNLTNRQIISAAVGSSVSFMVIALIVAVVAVATQGAQSNTIETSAANHNSSTITAQTKGVPGIEQMSQRTGKVYIFFNPQADEREIMVLRSELMLLGIPEVKYISSAQAKADYRKVEPLVDEIDITLPASLEFYVDRLLVRDAMELIQNYNTASKTKLIDSVKVGDK